MPNPALGRVLSIVAISLTLVSQATWAADVTVTLDASSGFVIENNTASVERLRVDEATGNISRNGALFVHTSGTKSLFVGSGAGSTSIAGQGNSAFGWIALSANTTGVRNSAFGGYALTNNTEGHSNSAFGYTALYSNLTGDRNAAFGWSALAFNTAGNYNSAFGTQALAANTSGKQNSAFGYSALASNFGGDYNSAFGNNTLRYNTGGFRNSAFGGGALGKNATGSDNSAVGSFALHYNTVSNNSAFGSRALQKNSTGIDNSAFGRFALFESGGDRNTSVGSNALNGLTSGDDNVAVGSDAGSTLTSGTNNIYIKNIGVGNESSTIRIGNFGHTQTFIEGIHGNLASGGSTVLINTSNELHTVVSSLRFKHDVRDLGETSELLMRLRPVAFRYKEEVAAGEDMPQYGLIAEEVAEVAPELVAYDGEGEPYSVRYHVLPSLLLNEVQKQQRVNEEQRQVIEEQQQVVAALTGRLDMVEQQLATVSADLGR